VRLKGYTPKTAQTNERTCEHLDFAVKLHHLVGVRELGEVIQRLDGDVHRFKPLSTLDDARGALAERVVVAPLQR
jgi:hypothetical protein